MTQPGKYWTVWDVTAVLASVLVITASCKDLSNSGTTETYPNACNETPQDIEHDDVLNLCKQLCPQCSNAKIRRCFSTKPVTWDYDGFQPYEYEVIRGKVFTSPNADADKQGLKCYQVDLCLYNSSRLQGATCKTVSQLDTIKDNDSDETCDDSTEEHGWCYVNYQSSKPEDYCCKGDETCDKDQRAVPQFLRCRNRISCRNRLKFLSEERDYPHDVVINVNNASDSILRDYRDYGMAICRNDEDRKSYWTVSRYWSWENGEVDKCDIFASGVKIKIENTTDPNTTSSNYRSPLTFTCLARAFDCMEGITWKLINQTGKAWHVTKTNELCSMSESFNLTCNYIKATLTITTTPLAVSCLCNRWASIETINSDNAKAPRKPMIVNMTEPFAVHLNADHTLNKTFHCQAVGHPTPTITWLKDNKKLEKEFTIAPDENGTAHSFSDTLKSLVGHTFTCRASNEHGYDIQSIFVIRAGESDHWYWVGPTLAFLIVFVVVVAVASPMIHKAIERKAIAAVAKGKVFRLPCLNMAFMSNTLRRCDSWEIDLNYRFVTKYEKGVLVKSGTSGKVWTCEATIDGADVKGVLKEMKNPSPTSRKEFMDELKYWQKIAKAREDPFKRYIAKWIGHTETEDFENIILFMEEYDKDLEQRLRDSQNPNNDLTTKPGYTTWAHVPDGYTDHDPDTKISTSTLLRLCIQICRGLVYLHDIEITHNDLAARNILLKEKTLPNSQNTVLNAYITDFGLGRGANKNLGTRKHLLGMPPEELNEYADNPVNSELSPLELEKAADVWGFGILLWEIYTLGRETPYDFLDENKDYEKGVAKEMKKDIKEQTRKLTEFLNQSPPYNRLKKPKNNCCDPEIYSIMLYCWTAKPEERPCIRDVLKRLEAFARATNVSVDDDLE